MSESFKRRLERIEAVLMPKPSVPVVILVEPGIEASAEDQAAFEQRIESAVVDGWRVLLVRAPGVRADRYGVEYVASEVEAQMIALASQPSEQGRANALSDLFAGLSGNVLGVTAEAREPGNRHPR